MAEKLVSDYDVGYGRPPLETRFKPGRAKTGGRQPGTRNRDALVRQVAAARTAAAIGGQLVVRCNLEWVIDVVKKAAAKGDRTALDLAARFTGMDLTEDEPIAKGVLIVREKLTLEEWEAACGASFRREGHSETAMSSPRLRSREPRERRADFPERQGLGETSDPR